MRNRSIVFAAVLMLVVSACSSSDAEPESAPSDTQASTATTVADAGGGEDTGATDETSAPDDTAPTADVAPEAGGDGPMATLTLANGESFSFSILCALEPQTAANQEILFVVVSYDNPYNLDVTQFGEDSFGGAANISLYDSASYDTVWEASTLYGGDIDLDLSGNTVTGSGVFFPDGEPTNEGVAGDFVANC